GLPIRAIEGERAAAFSERLRQGLGKVLEEDHSNWWNAIRLDAAGELFDPGGPQVATWRRMWESSRPVRPSRARSVWSPDTHQWEAEHLWSGAGWHPDAGLGTDVPPETPAPEPETPAPEPDPPAGGATEAALARVEEVLAQAMQQPDETLGAYRASTRDLRPTSGTPAEPTTGGTARSEGVL